MSAPPAASAAPGASGEAPIAECRGTMPGAWPAGAGPVAYRCKLSLLRAPGFLSDTAMDPIASQPRGDGLTGAYAGEQLVGIRQWSAGGTPPQPGDGMLDLTGATFVEQGRAGALGELWWARAARGSYRCCSLGSQQLTSLDADPLHARNESDSLLIAAGQESSVRQLDALTDIVRMQQMLMGQRGPWPAGSTSLRYTQLAATSALLQGSAPVPPGTLSDAQIELSVPEQLSGVLQFRLTANGKTSMVSLPLKRDVDESRATGPIVRDRPYRLKHGRRSGGRIQDCHAAPRSSTPGPCLIADPDETRSSSGSQEPQYTARGMFFGAQAQYLAIAFAALLPDPVDPKVNWGEFRGLLILQRTP